MKDIIKYLVVLLGLVMPVFGQNSANSYVAQTTSGFTAQTTLNPANGTGVIASPLPVFGNSTFYLFAQRIRPAQWYAIASGAVSMYDFNINLQLLSLDAVCAANPAGAQISRVDKYFQVKGTTYGVNASIGFFTAFNSGTWTGPFWVTNSTNSPYIMQYPADGTIYFKPSAAGVYNYELSAYDPSMNLQGSTTANITVYALPTTATSSGDLEVNADQTLPVGSPWASSSGGVLTYTGDPLDLPTISIVFNNLYPTNQTQVVLNGPGGQVTFPLTANALNGTVTIALSQYMTTPGNYTFSAETYTPIGGAPGNPQVGGYGWEAIPLNGYWIKDTIRINTISNINASVGD